MITCLGKKYVERHPKKKSWSYHFTYIESVNKPNGSSLTKECHYHSKSFLDYRECLRVATIHYVDIKQIMARQRKEK